MSSATPRGARASLSGRRRPGRRLVILFGRTESALATNYEFTSPKPVRGCGKAAFCNECESEMLEAWGTDLAVDISEDSQRQEAQKTTSSCTCHPPIPMNRGPLTAAQMRKTFAEAGSSAGPRRLPDARRGLEDEEGERSSGCSQVLGRLS